MRAKQMVSICLAFTCCVCILFAFLLSARAENSTTNAWVWNGESYRVRIYETSDLTNENRFYSPYLLNGYPVRIQEWSNNGNSVCISFLKHTFWIDSTQILILPPEGTMYPVFRTTIEDISLSSPEGGYIPQGTQVDIRGYTGDSVIICYKGEILEIHPSILQLKEITYEAPEYLLPQTEIIHLCKQELVNIYGLSASSLESMRIEFVSYSTLSSPALYIIRFYTETGDIYTLHCDGEFGEIIDTHYSPYSVG